MAGCKTDIDWTAKPEPWGSAGRRFKVELACIHAGVPIKISDAEIVRQWRGLLGLTQAEVAREAGVPERQVQRAEADTASGRIVRKIKAALSRLEVAGR